MLQTPERRRAAMAPLMRFLSAYHVINGLVGITALPDPPITRLPKHNPRHFFLCPITVP
jgi:hypothetical protein